MTTSPQPGRILSHVADLWGVEVSDILVGTASAARRDAVHRIAAANPDMSMRAVGRAVCLVRVQHIMVTDPPVPPDDAPARPVDVGMCTVDGCDREHRSSGLRMCSGHVARWRRHSDLDADRPLRPVNQDGPTLDLDLHDRTGYRYGCRCDTCRADAVAWVKRNRLRPQSRPIADGLASLARLTDAGMTVPQAAAAAGIGSACLYSWLNGTVSCCWQSTIDKLDAVPLPCEDCGQPAVDDGRWCRPCMDTRFGPGRTVYVGGVVTIGGPDPRRHGTPAGARIHEDRDEPLCEPCRTARANHRAELRARRDAA